MGARRGSTTVRIYTQAVNERPSIFQANTYHPLQWLRDFTGAHIPSFCAEQEANELATPESLNSRPCSFMLAKR